MKTMNEKRIKLTPDQWGYDNPPEETRGAILDAIYEEENPTFRLLDIDDINSMPPPSWLIQDMVPAQGITTVFGAPGSAKSFLALDMALSIATGSAFHGKTCHPGQVVYSLGEGLSGLKYRIEAWCLAHPTADRDLIKKNFVVIPKAVHLLEKHDTQMLYNTIRRVGSVDLLIIDTLARALVGGDENSAGDIGMAISVCDTVRDMCGSATMLVHHMDAQGTKARGSTAIPGASDCMIKMVKDENQKVIRVTNTKQKDAEEFKSMFFDLNPYGHSAALTARQVDTTPYRSPQQRRDDRNPF